MGCLPTALVAVLAVLIVAGVALLGASRYAGLLNDVDAVQDHARRLAQQIRTLEPSDLDRDTVTALQAEVQSLDEHLQPLTSVLDDPLVALARRLPGVTVQADAADAMLAAAGDLVEAAGIGLDLADQVVTMRENDAADPDYQLTASLVGLVATSGVKVDRVASLVADAQARLETIPPEAAGRIREARDLVAEPLERYAPLLEEYRQLDDVVPAIMGWGGEKHYLVLAQNPAELRPAGGYTGTVGLITLRDGSVVEQRFQNVYDLDLRKDLPFIEPPTELTDLLLAPDDDGSPQSWRLADAAWDADFPTGAARAAEFYALETDGVMVDGVIAITTYALDRLLEVVGPVEVPSYGVTVEAGDVTLTLLGATRGAPGDLEGRKDVLDALARTLMQRLLGLSPDHWAAMIEALDDIGREHMALAWFKDPEAQSFVIDNGWSGSVRQDPGDYLYVVESNVAPTSKYNLVVDRSDSLVVKLDETGSATNSLRLDWQNRAGDEGDLYAALRSFSESDVGVYGAYLRTLVPLDSEIVRVRGEDAIQEIGATEYTGEESGRRSWGNSLLMTPGESTLTYLWTVPEVATMTDAGWEYRLVIQKQPGARTSPIKVRIELPAGATLLETSDGLRANGDRLLYEGELDTDLELRVLYELPPA